MKIGVFNCYLVWQEGGTFRRVFFFLLPHLELSRMTDQLEKWVSKSN